MTVPVELHHHSVDEPHPIKVIVIGAGVSGILAGIRLPQYLPQIDLTIYEKSESFGGTWFENRYPGLTCDIPSHVYSYTFEPNPSWSRFYSGGPEILAYLTKVAKKYDVLKYIKTSHKIVGATWDKEQGKWNVKIEHNGVVFEDECNVLISATGCLNNWKWPTLDGLQEFKGKLLHSANWDTEWDWSGQKIAIIGAGSSALQILPQMQKTASDVYHYVRGKTWVSAPFGGDYIIKAIKRNEAAGNFSYSNEEIETFEKDPQAYYIYRKALEQAINLDHACLFKGTKYYEEGLKAIQENMRTKLAKRPEIYEQMKPDWSPGCRRLTPAPGLLEALVEDNVHFVPGEITRITEDSVISADGTERKVDAVVCATGFDTSFTPRFPIIGTNGVSLADEWRDHPNAYMSLAIPKFPNFFIIGGPNSATGGGSLLAIFEAILEYTVECTKKMAREKIKAMEVQPVPTEAWGAYVEAFFKTSVHSENCRSWYNAGKQGGRVVGLWPGSSVHARKALKFPRWEDFTYELKDEESSPMGWLGDGWSVLDRGRGDVAFYLDEADFPPVTSTSAKV